MQLLCKNEVSDENDLICIDREHIVAIADCIFLARLGYVVVTEVSG